MRATHTARSRWTEEVTPPITPPRAQAMEVNTATETVPETHSPVQKPGRSRGRGTWRAQQKVTPGVGTRSRTRLAEIEKLEATQAQAAHAEWPPTPDTTKDIQRLTRELRLCDVGRRGRNSSISPASRGWSDDAASGCVLHPSTSRCWWREGEFSPSEYGNAGAHPSTGSISCGAVAQGPRLQDDPGNQTQSLQHHAPHQDWHVGPVGFPPTMGRGDASPR